MNEEWRPVVGYEGLYEVSDQGRVRRMTATQRGPAGRLLKPQRMKIGYLSVILCTDGRPRLHYLHRLVAEAFLGPGLPETEVNHKDGNRQNPRLANLEYVTSSENKYHAVAMGLMPQGEACPWAKLTATEAQFIWEHFRLGVDSAGEWGERFRCSPGNIYAIAQGRSWKSIHAHAEREVA